MHIFPENTEDVHGYEFRRFLPSNDAIENAEPHGLSDESNYTDLRHSALFPIYDNPHECMPCPHENAAPVDALLDVLIDEENDSIWPYSLAKANWSSDSTQDKNPIVQKKYKDDDDAKEYDVVKKDNLKDDDVNGEENASKNDL